MENSVYRINAIHGHEQREHGPEAIFEGRMNLIMLKEKNEQEVFVRYCDLKGIVCVHIPNGFPLGGLKNKFAYINAIKAQGYKAGFPDLIVFAKNSVHKLLFLEFKREKGGTLSPKQKDWINWLNDNGYYAKCVKGSQEAIKELELYLSN